jgi:hypothetical protein
MTPNLVKTLHHWGLDEQLRSFSLRSEDQIMLLCEHHDICCDAHGRARAQSAGLLLNYTRYTDESGEMLGKHHWSEESLHLMGGDFEFTHASYQTREVFGLNNVLIFHDDSQHTDLRELLAETATRLGVDIRYNCKVVAVNDASEDEDWIAPISSSNADHSSPLPNPLSVTLSSGLVLGADVIIGADGRWGKCRKTVMAANGETEHVTPVGVTMYKFVLIVSVLYHGLAENADIAPCSTTIPLEMMSEDPELSWLITQKAVFTWYGDERFVIGYPVVRAEPRKCSYGLRKYNHWQGGHGGKNEFALHIYGPHEEDPKGSWDEQVPIAEMQEAMGLCEPRRVPTAHLLCRMYKVSNDFR